MKFKVTYINKNNEKSVEFIDAVDKIEIKNKLENEFGFFVIDIENAASKDNTAFFGAAGRNNAAAFDLYMFTRELAILLRSGITMPDSLEIIENNIAGKTFKNAVNQVRNDVVGGTPFSEAVKKMPDFFPATYSKALRSGEMSSSMVEVLELLAQNLKKVEKIKNKVQNATIYPAALVLIALLIVNFLMVFVIPSFENVFYELKIKTPFFTGIFFMLSAFLKKYFVFVVIVFVLLTIFLLKITGAKNFKNIMLGAGLKVPVVKGLIADYLLFVFSGMFSVLMKSNTPAIEAVSGAIPLLAPMINKKQQERLIDDIKSGMQLAPAFKSLNLPGGVIERIAAIGERSGRLNEMFEAISEYYSERIENTVEKGAALIEPVAIFFIGIFVAMIVMAVFLPLIQIASSNY